MFRQSIVSELNACDSFDCVQGHLELKNLSLSIYKSTSHCLFVCLFDLYVNKTSQSCSQKKTVKGQKR